MKKSKILIPAMALLLFSTAASITGTVAWFSSVSTAETNVGVFTAARMDGNLSLDFTADKGTDYINSSDHTQGVKVIEGSTMTHASYDHKNAKLYTISYDSNTGLREVTSASNWVAKSNYDGNNHNIYWAVSWTMTFTFNFAQETNVNLYFDPASSLTNSNTGGTLNSEAGFRIAFVGQTSTHGDPVTHIWAGKRAAASCKYIRAADTSVNPAIDGFQGPAVNETAQEAASRIATNRAGFAYGSDEVIGNDFTVKPTDHDEEGDIASANSGVDFLGQFHKDTSADSTLVFKCVAWYEGTDASIAPETTTMSSLSAKMKFYAREASAVYPTPANNG